MSTLPLVTSSEAIATEHKQSLNPTRLWKVTKAKVSGRFGYALADQVVYSFGNMMVAAIISRHCAQRDFGIYILTQRAMDVLIQISNVLLWAPFTFHLPGTSEERLAGYQGSMLLLQVFLCISFTALLLFAARLTTAPSRTDLSQTFAPLVVTSAGILFREFTRRMYFAHMRFREAFWTEVATILLQVGTALLLWMRDELTIPNVLLGLSGSAILVSLWWVLREWRSLRLSVREAGSDLKHNLELGRWFLGSNMVFLASSQCNPWVLSAVLGGASVGAYAICESVVNIPRVALTSMQNVMGPMLARAEHQEGKDGVRKAVRRLDRTLLASSTALSLVIWAVGPLVARLIFKTTLTNTRTVLLLLALNLVAYSSTLAQSYGLTALGRVDTTFFANGFGLIAQGVACVFLVRAFHVPGAAAAMLLGSLVVLVTRQWFFYRAVQTA